MFGRTTAPSSRCSEWPGRRTTRMSSMARRWSCRRLSGKCYAVANKGDQATIRCTLCRPLRLFYCQLRRIARNLIETNRLCRYLDTRWCNGNTRDFGSLVQGSNPCRVACLFCQPSPMSAKMGQKPWFSRAFCVSGRLAGIGGNWLRRILRCVFWQKCGGFFAPSDAFSKSASVTCK